MLRLAHRFFDALDAGDLDAIAGLLHDDVEWAVPATLPDGGTFRGARVVLDDLFGRRDDTWGDVAVVRDRWVDGGETVVVEGRFVGTAPSGTAYEVPFCNVLTFRGGRLVRFVNHTDTAMALAAVGPRG